jgi:signal transduction histidine kinase
MIGGKLGVESTPGQGTTVRAEIPINEDAPEPVPKTLHKNPRST